MLLLKKTLWVALKLVKALLLFVGTVVVSGFLLFHFGQPRFRSEQIYYKKTLSFGKRGTGPGEFRLPLGGLVFDDEGFIYIADVGTQRIQKFSPDGKFLLEFSGPKKNKDENFYPSRLIFGFDGYLYALNHQNHSLYVFNKKGSLLRTIDVNRNQQLTKEKLNCFSFAIDKQGNIYLASNQLSLSFFVVMLNPEGKLIKGIAPKPNKRANLFVKLSKVIIGSVAGITIDSSGQQIFVVDSLSNRVYEFDADGNAIKRLGGIFGTGSLLRIFSGQYWVPVGFFERPMFIKRDNQGVLYVIEQDGRMQKIAPDGAFVYNVTYGGNAQLAFLNVDAQQNIWHLETFGDRVQIIKRQLYRWEQSKNSWDQPKKPVTSPKSV